MEKGTEGTLEVPGWGREKGVGLSWVHPAAGHSWTPPSGLPDWTASLGGLDPGIHTGGRGLLIDQVMSLHVT